MSKTERALDTDAGALDELEDFVAAEAAAADRAIGELIDEAIEPTNGAGAAELDEFDNDDMIGSNGFDTSEIEVLDEADVLDDVDVIDVDRLELLEEIEDALDTGAVGTDAEIDAVEDEQLDGAEADSVESTPLDDLVETDDGIVDDEVAEETDDEPYELPEIVPATVDDDEESDEADDDERGVAAAAAAAGVVGAVARVGELDEVSDDILEELRRADIDGPIVDLAPQDDTTSARRRPKRRPDYDPAPVPIPARPPRILGRKPRVRKVTRVVRHVDPWSVFKIAAVAFAVLYVVVLTASVLLWNVAYATGTVDNVERFFESFGWSSFEFKGGEIYHASWIMGIFVAIGLTGLAVLTATLFNLITDIVGGMRFTVLEEEVVETRTSPMRRFVIRRPEPEIPVVISDESGSMIREAVVDDSGAIER